MPKFKHWLKATSGSQSGSEKTSLQDCLDLADRRGVKFCNKNGNILTQEEIATSYPNLKFKLSFSKPHFQSCLEAFKEQGIFITDDYSFKASENFDRSSFIYHQPPPVPTINSTANAENTESTAVITTNEPMCPVGDLIDFNPYSS